MKKILSMVLFALMFSHNVKSQSSSTVMITVLEIENLTTGENNLNYRGNGVMNLKLKATGTTQAAFLVAAGLPPYFPTFRNINLKIFIKKANITTPILIAQQNNVAYNAPPNGPSIYQPTASHIFNVVLYKFDYKPGDVMYATAQRSDGVVQYYYPSLNKTISDCPFTPAPTNISVLPYSYGYTVNLSPQGGYLMEYVDLITNSSGSTNIYTSSTQGTVNFFYYVPQGNSFKFRLKSLNSSCALFSNWFIYGSDVCQPSNYPTNLYVFSQCDTQGIPSVCGGVVQWSSVLNATSYQIEYLIYNSAGQSYSGTIDTSYNYTSQTLVQPVSSVSGPWLIKIRARSKCVDGVWSNFSSWSTSFSW